MTNSDATPNTQANTKNKDEGKCIRKSTAVVIMVLSGVILLIALHFAWGTIQKEKKVQKIYENLRETIFSAESLKVYLQDNTQALKIAEQAYKMHHPHPKPGTSRLLAKIGYSSFAPPFYSTFFSHAGAVRCAVFSPNGAPRILTASDDKTIREWNLSGKELLRLDASKDGHGQRVSTAFYSPDGTLIISASWDRTVKLWDRQGNLLATKTLDGVVSSAEFSKNGGRIVSGTRGGKAYVFNINGRQLSNGKTFEHGESVVHASFSPDGNYILTRSWGNEVKLWNIETNHQVILAHEKSVTSACFFPDERSVRVLTSSEDGTAVVWNQEGTALARMDHGTKVSYALVCPDIKLDTIFTATHDGDCYFWDLNGQKKKTVDAQSGKIKFATFSENGLLLATVSAKNITTVWHESGDIKARLKPFNSNILSACFSPDSHKLVIAREDGLTGVWNLDTPMSINLNRHRAGVNSAVFSSDGNWVVTASDDNNAILWESNIQSIGRYVTHLKGHSAPIQQAIFSPSSQRIVTVSSDRTARLWDATGRLLKKMDHSFPVNLTAYSPKGDYFVTVTDDGFEIRVWDKDGNGGNKLKPVHNRLITAISFSKDGKTILTASEDGSAKITELLSGKRIVSFKGHGGLVASAVFSPDEEQKFVLTASHDKFARKWSRGNPKEPLVKFSHDDKVSGAVFSPDGNQVLTTSYDGTAKLWTNEGKQKLILDHNKRVVISGKFSPGGKYLLTVSKPNQVKLWNLEGDLLAELEGHNGDIKTAVFSPEKATDNFLYVLTASQDGSARLWMTPESIYTWLNTSPRPIPALPKDKKEALEIKELSNIDI